MKKKGLVSIIALGLIVSFSLFSTEAIALTAEEVLTGVDDVMNAPKDQILKQKVVLIDKKGKEKERTLLVYQKGFDKRLARFLSPADQKGIAFLSLPNDVIYLYLPAFKKVRRIATHVKNTKFAGTDFTYEDMEAKRYSENWIPELLNTEKEHFIMQIKPKSGIRTNYSKMVFKVRKDNLYPVKVELYSRAGKLFKVATTTNIKKIGKYWVAEEATMEDLKSRHKTKMILLKAQFDTGISDKKFTKRYLKR